MTSVEHSSKSGSSYGKIICLPLRVSRGNVWKLGKWRWKWSLCYLECVFIPEAMFWFHIKRLAFCKLIAFYCVGFNHLSVGELSFKNFAFGKRECVVYGDEVVCLMAMALIILYLLTFSLLKISGKWASEALSAFLIKRSRRKQFWNAVGILLRATRHYYAQVEARGTYFLYGAREQIAHRRLFNFPATQIAFELAELCSQRRLEMSFDSHFCT
jgi:hypothetical protein